MINLTHTLCFTYRFSVYTACCLYWYGMPSGMAFICEKIVFSHAIFHSPELYMSSAKVWSLNYFIFFPAGR